MNYSKNLLILALSVLSFSGFSVSSSAGNCDKYKTGTFYYRIKGSDSVTEYQTKSRGLKNNTSPRPFDYCIDLDKDWKLAEWHLSD